MNDLVPQDNGGGRQPIATLKLDTMEGKLKALAVLGGGGESGKDWIPANKPVDLEIDDVILSWVDGYVSDDGEVVKEGWRASCILRSGDIVRFSSFRVVNYLKACLQMWASNWQGLVLRLTKKTTGGKTNYTVEYVREGDWRD